MGIKEKVTELLGLVGVENYSAAQEIVDSISEIIDADLASVEDRISSLVTAHESEIARVKAAKFDEIMRPTREDVRGADQDDDDVDDLSDDELEELFDWKG